jgi:signal transduction protein with GAF and PtsI domain
MSSDPAAVILLVGMGIQRLSMSAARLPQIKWLIRNIDTGYARRLLAEVRDLPDSSTIRDTMNRHLQDLRLP